MINNTFYKRGGKKLTHNVTHTQKVRKLFRCESSNWRLKTGITILIFLSLLLATLNQIQQIFVLWNQHYICCLLQVLSSCSRLWRFKLWKSWTGAIETYTHIVLFCVVQNLLLNWWFSPGMLDERQSVSACCIGAVRRQEEFLLDRCNMWSEA